MDYCDHGCGYLSISSNSCRNRHCPKCQSLKQAKWLEERRERLLSTDYFHLVVTLPHELKPLVLCNQELVFNLFFAAASRALMQFAWDYDRLRAQVGFTAVLHTWDQSLNFHPHLHIVVTGGRLSADADTWIAASNSFLLPVKALSKIIRSKFLEALDQARRTDCRGRFPVWPARCRSDGSSSALNCQAHKWFSDIKLTSFFDYKSFYPTIDLPLEKLRLNFDDRLQFIYNG